MRRVSPIVRVGRRHVRQSLVREFIIRIQISLDRFIYATTNITRLIPPHSHFFFERVSMKIKRRIFDFYLVIKMGGRGGAAFSFFSFIIKYRKTIITFMFYILVYYCLNCTRIFRSLVH